MKFLSYISCSEIRFRFHGILWFCCLFLSTQNQDGNDSIRLKVPTQKTHSLVRFGCSRGNRFDKKFNLFFRLHFLIILSEIFSFEKREKLNKFRTLFLKFIYFSPDLFFSFFNLVNSNTWWTLCSEENTRTQFYICHKSSFEFFFGKTEIKRKKYCSVYYLNIYATRYVYIFAKWKAHSLQSLFKLWKHSSGDSSGYTLEKFN